MGTLHSEGLPLPKKAVEGCHPEGWRPVQHLEVTITSLALRYLLLHC